LAGVEIRSTLGNACTVRYGDRVVELKPAAGEEVKLSGMLEWR
jgi:hypothetical protein